MSGRPALEANPRVMAQDFLGTLVVWDAAMQGTLTRRELYGAREMFASFDPEPRRQEVLRGLMDFAKQRLAKSPMAEADAAEVRRVFGALPFGPMDEVPRQMVFVLWLWSRFDREREIVRASIAAARATLLAEVKRLTELPKKAAEQAVPIAAEGLNVDLALEKFLAFVTQTSGHPPSWGRAIARGLAKAMLDGLPNAKEPITPDELTAAVWCSYRIDERSFHELVSAS